MKKFVAISIIVGSTVFLAGCGEKAVSDADYPTVTRPVPVFPTGEIETNVSSDSSTGSVIYDSGEIINIQPSGTPTE